MIELFKQSLLRSRLVKKSDVLLLGVSGGPDSLAMLHLFVALRKEFKLTLTACHFNHALRKEADAEEQFVKKTCGDCSVKCLSEKKPVADFFDGDSLEQTARQLRYDFFLKCGRQVKAKKLVLAHHKDDLAETVLMRIIRGAGLRGLRAILPRSKYKSLTVVRPLMEFRKQELVDWLDKNKFDYCIDESNFSEEFLRNKVRLKLLPLLAQINPAIVDSLYHLSQITALDYDYLETTAREALAKIKKHESTAALELDLQAATHLHDALFNNIIMEGISQLKGNTRRIEGRHLEEIRDLVLRRPAGSVVDLPFIIVRKTENRLILQKKNGPYAY